MDPVASSGMSPGQRIKLYRQRAGLTQEVAAQLKGVTVSAWRKWESGERSVNTLGDWIEIARILRVRDLYRLTGMPVGQLPDEQAEHESVQPVRAALHAYAPTLDGPVDIAALRRSINWAWDTWTGSPHRYSRTAPLLADLILTTRATLTASSGAVRRDAERAAADIYLLVRSFGKRVGAADVAYLAADRAMAAAHAADDPAYRAAAGWNLAQVLSNRGHTEESARMCEDAIRDVEAASGGGPAGMALAGSLRLLLAVQRARLRDERRALEAIEDAARLAAITGETTYHRTFFGPANVGIHRAAVTLELSRTGEALRLAERVDVGDLSSVERRYSHYLQLGRAYAIRREDLAAVHMLGRADRESPEDSRLNLVMRATVRELLVRETPTTRPDLRGLAERVGVI
ncbi:helix-turn-helix domain-containing protein [Micromonospora sp. NBC_01655]|uniref:helix-turn-helix domain-containing protein n=1 Tax=Micromonospora sp. NBC_01655 TaxID=2975983 RepID=UPI00224DBF4F|nr:helix-turn-helix transcriptional regulator [Micromonospora sp. NBC_01655]MCX4472091.1 helix-turn-helix domain-containing protein [Micromonospora sp. NBC_01655]